MPRRSVVRWSHLLFVAAFFGLLMAPGLAGHWWHGVQIAENRTLAPPPQRPRSWQQLLAWPKQADDYLADHFGGRLDMVVAFNRARYRLFGETPGEQAVFGQHGRLFLTSHDAIHPYSLIGFICGVDVADKQLDAAAADLDVFFRQAKSWATESYLMSVPTAPALYGEDLAPWLQSQCSATTMDRLLPRLQHGDLANHLLYPRAAMAEAKSRGQVIPLTNFHWQGVGAEAAAVAFAEGRLGLSPRMTLPTRVEVEPSDIGQMIAGIPTATAVRLPDYLAAGVQYCLGPACFPALGAAANVIADLSSLRSPQAGDKKLLILSDSFGTALVGWFAPYFGSVWHFSVSNLGRLSADQREAFRRQVFADYRPDVVLYVLHDGSIHYWPKLAAQNLWGP